MARTVGLTIPNAAPEAKAKPAAKKERTAPEAKAKPAAKKEQAE